MKKRILATLLAGCLLLASAVGCQTEQSESTPGGDTQSTSSENGDKTSLGDSLTIWAKKHQLDSLNTMFQEKVDEIAERLLMLGSTPENKFSEYLKVAKVKEVSGISCGSDAVDHILDTYKHLISEERKVIELAEAANDVVTADLLTGYLKEQEKMVWMLVAFSTKSCTK